MGDETRGEREGQSVSSDRANKGCTLDVGLLVGGRAAVHSASKAGDGIRTRECLLGQSGRCRARLCQVGHAQFPNKVTFVHDSPSAEGHHAPDPGRDKQKGSVKGLDPECS